MRRTPTLAQALQSLLAVAVFVGAGAWIRMAWREAAGDPAFHVDAAEVRLLSVPDWMVPETAAAVALDLAAGASARGSLLDAKALREWTSDLAARSPWVAEVVEVTPRFPGQVDLRLRLARPVLSLPDGQLLAADGRRLGQGSVRLDPGPLRLDESTDESRHAEAAAAAQDLLPLRPLLAEQGLDVESLHVQQQPGLGDVVVFVTGSGVALEWGRSTRHQQRAAADLSPAERVTALLDVASRRPGLVGVERVVLWKERPDVLLRP